MSLENEFVVREIKNRKTLEPWLLQKHYLNRFPQIVKSYGLFSVAEKDIVGVCVYGRPPISNIGKSYFVNDINCPVIELSRLVINEGLPKNILSYFLAQTFKQLSKPVCLLSFADPNNGHHGYIYQATNWLYAGLSTGKSKKYFLKGKEYHQRWITVKRMGVFNIEYDSSKTIDENWINAGGEVIVENLQKYRYLMLLGDKRQKKIMMKNLKHEILPYPKGDNENYDCPDIINGCVENIKENQLNDLLFG